jgi:hypothetical protein
MNCEIIRHETMKNHSCALQSNKMILEEVLKERLD